MKNFKEIADKCIRGELSGIFILRNDARIPSKYLYKRTGNFIVYPYTFKRLSYTYTHEGTIYNNGPAMYDIVNFIPDKNMERNVKLTLEKAKEWYKKGGELKEVALQAYKEEELKDSKPRSWEEYCELMEGGSAYYISETSNIIEYEQISKNTARQDRNTLPSREIAEAFLAYMQLISLHQAWIVEWEPDWKNTNIDKFCIVVEEDSLKIIACRVTSCPLSFPTLKLANDFLGTFRDLIEKAKPLF